MIGALCFALGVVQIAMILALRQSQKRAVKTARSLGFTLGRGIGQAEGIIESCDKMILLGGLTGKGVEGVRSLQQSRRKFAEHLETVAVANGITEEDLAEGAIK